MLFCICEHPFLAGDSRIGLESGAVYTNMPRMYIFTMRRDGGAVSNVVLLNFTNWKLIFCENLEIEIRKNVHFPIFDVGRSQVLTNSRKPVSVYVFPSLNSMK